MTVKKSEPTLESVYPLIEKMSVKQVKEMTETITAFTLAWELGTDRNRVLKLAMNKRPAGLLNRFYKGIMSMSDEDVSELSKYLVEPEVEFSDLKPKPRLIA